MVADKLQTRLSAALQIQSVKKTELFLHVSSLVHEHEQQFYILLPWLQQFPPFQCVGCAPPTAVT